MTPQDKPQTQYPISKNKGTSAPTPEVPESNAADPAPAQADPAIAKMLQQIQKTQEKIAQQQADFEAKMEKREQLLLDRERAYQEKVNTFKPTDAAAVEEAHEVHATKQQLMKEQLSKQPKVRIIVPLDGGEKPGTTLPVTLNGYRLNIPKGVYVDVPQQVADIIMDSQGQTNAAESRKRLDLQDEERTRQLQEAGMV